ncbi:bifunctional protein FolD 2-like [Momordica charantia]|uniref:Bifunctional protein FolD 2-like n=1 Tax=Momordica charantia TaxID=3673 RepID=A0A6J1CQR1_MOMCH|nr:bifunctional protein FolD 2-like [Momordica charantia]
MILRNPNLAIGRSPILLRWIHFSSHSPSPKSKHGNKGPADFPERFHLSNSVSLQSILLKSQLIHTVLNLCATHCHCYKSRTDKRFPLSPAKMASDSGHKATIIDGKEIAQTVRSEIAEEVSKLSEKYGKVPGLAEVIVGSRKCSLSYVNLKRKACAEVGIKYFGFDLPEQVSEAELIAKIHELNANPEVHGILVQLRLPRHINEEKVLAEISIEKDIDGFHPLNIGKLAMKGRDPLFLPCTPKGCLELLSRSGISIRGKKAVVLGRSNIVGIPVSLLLLKADATVTIVHSLSGDPESVIREADIIIAAAGLAQMIKGSWIKPGATVIDVGTNAVDDPTTKSGYRLVGDVDFQEACKVAGWITPVPGGVGPMAVAMMLRNTLDGAKRVIEQ